jgi:hypothetical protein
MSGRALRLGCHLPMDKNAEMICLTSHGISVSSSICFRIVKQSLAIDTGEGEGESFDGGTREADGDA